ncbi:threonylcarbamoyl-AMP synthase [Roseibium sp. CAU 1637]|uniref:Threonylcarbamoyl-AMP synthase n=1 Tax=Roseibium limicola TaxID=2816037 RepID=A0A939J9K1_9HYPH|nr:L-threonylcarbamoyladenylate synthase [Roseibium limicola]MBO0345473.1 threonylcarbamoyl-AMP synthase [Roseibium limicola]
MHRWTVNLNTRSWLDSPEAAEVAGSLTAGQLIAVPTETVYGLAADASNGEACARIYEAKGRPQFNPLISHVESFSRAQTHGVFSPSAIKLAKAFWPGPLTLVLPRKDSSPISSLATAGLSTVALRVPAGPVMRFLAETTGRPIAAPSANLSGKISPTTADDVAADLGNSLAWLIDAGPCTVGVESTILSVIDDNVRLLRPGGLSREDIEAVLGYTVEGVPQIGGTEAPLAPGMLSSHYAPRAGVRLNAHNVKAGEALLTFGSLPVEGQNLACSVFNLSETGSLTEAAANLFSGLRKLDATGSGQICVAPIPFTGLGEAINDRLIRAAAPRD